MKADIIYSKIRDVSEEHYGKRLSRKEAVALVRTFTQSITELLAEGYIVPIKNLGTYRTRRSAAKKIKPPYSDTVIEIPERTVPHFSASTALKEAVSETTPRNYND